MTDAGRAQAADGRGRDTPAWMREVRSAALVLGDPLGWLADRANDSTPEAVECWVLDTTSTHVVLVRHRVRGWVAPGGTVEPGEDPRSAARRELREETGLDVALDPHPVLACLRRYRSDWEPTISLAYVGVATRGALVGEAGQPCRWAALSDPWDSVFPEDRERILRHVGRGASAQGRRAGEVRETGFEPARP